MLSFPNSKLQKSLNDHSKCTKTTSTVNQNFIMNYVNVRMDERNTLYTNYCLKVVASF